MDIQEIIWQAVAVVGVTELVKKFIPADGSKWKALITLAVTLIVTVSVHFLPWVLSPLLVLSVATVSYDTVFDLLKSLVSGIKGKEEK
jgi:predicted DNA repair protein MutK